MNKNAEIPEFCLKSLIHDEGTKKNGSRERRAKVLEKKVGVLKKAKEVERVKKCRIEIRL